MANLTELTSIFTATDDSIEASREALVRYNQEQGKNFITQYDDLREISKEFTGLRKEVIESISALYLPKNAEQEQALLVKGVVGDTSIENENITQVSLSSMGTPRSN